MMSGFDTPYWNALQVLAWVYLRDRALVTRCGNAPNSTGRSFWQKHKVPGEDGGCLDVLHETASGPPTEIALSLEAAVSGGARYPIIEDAKRDIWCKLTAGALAVTGRPKGGSTRQEIPALQWHDLNIEYEPASSWRGPVEQSSAVDTVSKCVVYDRLLWSPEAVLKLWPDVLADEQERRLAAEYAEANRRRRERQAVAEEQWRADEKKRSEFARKEAIQRLKDTEARRQEA
jgi:hypothetical protein